MSSKSLTFEKAYQILTIDDDRACRDIPDSACREVPETERPLYVSVSNTMVGIIFLGSSLVGLLAGVIGVQGVIGAFTLMMLAGSMMAFRLPDPENMVPDPESAR